MERLILNLLRRFHFTAQVRDMSAAHPAGDAHAHASRAASLLSSGRYARAALAYAAAASADPEYADLAIKALCRTFRGIKNLQPEASRKAGKAPKPGELVTVADDEFVEVLANLLTTPNTNVNVRYAAMLTFAAACVSPSLKAIFLKPDNQEAMWRTVIAPLARTPEQELDRTFPARGSLSPILAKVHTSQLHAPYEKCPPQAVVTLMLGNLVAHPTACETNPAIIALFCSDLLSAASELVGRVAGDATSAHHLGRFYTAVTRACEIGGYTEIMAAERGGVKTALEKLLRDADERDDAPAKKAFGELHRIIYRHPDHPDNQVPNGD
ncbi:hypothetical protein PPROV_000666500 [Pycnococcus provasolii]|uniref:Uncharacterized protein n=1 Tax=Pycnococcus provasolii TaxID=41880 RepID=A0A830HMK4_9CHLO|nr:hypothetical protein PPROV_000666500 [Pycnococcus provasolii]